MPYFITQSNPDCNGWAVEKEDGELMGCHSTKQGAIDQMVAISLAEGMEPGGERAIGDPKIKLSDIDGTLINGGRRVEKVWNYLQSQEGALFILTGRPESQRQETETELRGLDITYSRHKASRCFNPVFFCGKSKLLFIHVFQHRYAGR